MYCDIFVRIAVPRRYGNFVFNPLNFVELILVKLDIIQTESEQIEVFLDQLFYVADVQYGTGELERDEEEWIAVFRPHPAPTL